VAPERDPRISDSIRRERLRLRNFIRRRVRDDEDVQDILQDVFAELVEAWRPLEPIEEIGAWLFRVARNRIIDRFRRKHRDSVQPLGREAGEEDGVRWEDLLPSGEAGPAAAYARQILFDELAAALQELPQEQREVFVAHEMDGRSFKELSAETGVSVNTLLSRKRYAVMHLRARLQQIYREFRDTKEWDQ
jgi:RNA polymerase sigma factor (sigma-70 family)